MSLRQQSVAIDDLFILDDGSSDETIAIIERCIEHSDIRLIKLNSNSGRGAARAQAMLHAQNDLVLSSDSGKYPSKDFFERALVWFADQKVAAVFGRLLTDETKSLAARWTARHLHMCDRPGDFSRSALLATSCAVVRKSAVLAVGNYNPELTFGEDKDLGERLLRAGYAVIYDPAMTATELTKHSIDQALERYWRWHASPREKMSFYDYCRQILYSIKVMALKDLRKRDLLSALVSLFSPHYQYWRSMYENLRQSKVKRAP